MEKVRINYIVDLLLALSFVVTAVTALVIFLFLPEGVRQGRYQEFLGIAKFAWSNLHTVAGLAMVALSFLHLILHWRWMLSMTKSLFRAKAKKEKQ